MADDSGDMIKLLLDSGALSIWNRRTGPVFWYAAGVPGPFYLNTELMIGRELAEELLNKITSIVKETEDAEARATRLNTLIFNAYKKTPVFRQIIGALVDKARDSFEAGSYDLVTGGERRDWLFSIPFARVVGVRHAFLFKNKQLFCKEGAKPGERVLHVSDLINNAASHFDMWFPILEREKLICAGNLCINTRGRNGLDRLTKAGQKVAALNSIDLSFFDRSLTQGLIGQETFDELASFFSSSQEWGGKYLTKNVSVFNVDGLDKKSFERLQSFFDQDPWDMRAMNEEFFKEMQSAIERRKRAS